ncbi:SDR family NAD(P)-dependent oxidoreductase [Microbacterium sp. CJ77]|nr:MULTISPECIES: SDR family NAD(P)-dependent oxidoreductase [unclassified Microbacterium]
MSVARFTGKTAIVTGAGGTIGRATALRLAREGAKVLCVDRDEAALQLTVRALSSAGSEAVGHVADVTDEPSVAGYVAAAMTLGDGRVDAFFNNAGIVGPISPVEEYDALQFDRVMAVNVKGVFLGLKHVAAVMRSGASIVNTASVAGLVGSPGIAGYVASKHAVVGLTRTAALELAARNVRVNAICPGPVAGQLMASVEDEVGPGGHEAFLSDVPLGRYAAPEEIAATVCFLLSEESTFTSGSAVTIDAGQTAR